MRKLLHIWLSGITCLLLATHAWSQCLHPTLKPSFTLPDTVCINELFDINNTSTGADRYKWNFCSYLQEVPTVTELVTVSGASVPTNITTVFDGTNWYGFFFSRENNLLFRLDFGSNLDNTPTVVNVGNLGGTVNKAEPIEFIKEGSNWYAFTVNSFGNSSLVRLNFGTSLNNIPTATNLTNLDGKLNKPRGLKLAVDNGNNVAVVTNTGDNTLTIIDFGNSITNLPTSAQSRKTAAFPGTNNELVNTSIIQDCDTWYGITVSNANNRIYQLDFSTSLSNLPIITDLTAGLPVINTPFNPTLIKDDGYYCFIETFTGELIQLDFGSQMSNTPTFRNFSNYGLLKNIAGLSFNKINSDWIGLALSWSDNKVFKIKFPIQGNANICETTTPFPKGIFYTKSGVQKITLTAYNTSNESASITHSVFVRPSDAIADFKVTGAPPVFEGINIPGQKIIAWNWDFGDGTLGEGESIAHTYAQPGNYSVKLTIQSDCGQKKSITKSIGIDNNTALECPKVTFTIPDTVCINEALAVTTSSIGAERYEWNFCSGNLEEKPILEPMLTLGDAITPTDITTVFDGTDWYGFVSSRDNNKIFRLNYGPSLNNTPSVTDLGNPGGLLSRPEQMKILKIGSEWLGMVVNLNNFSNNFSVVKFNFGDRLTNIPAASSISELKNHLKLPRGIELINDNGNLVALITNTQSNILTIASFGNSFENKLTAASIKNILLPEATTGHNIMGVSVIKVCNQWVGLAVSNSNKIYKLNFGARLFSDPFITKITVAESLLLSPVKVSLTTDQSEFYAFIMHSNGKMVMLDFGTDIQNNTPALKESFGIVGDAVGMEFVKTASNTHYLFTVDWVSKIVYKFSFSNNCAASVSSTHIQTPSDIFYKVGGKQKITLTAFDENNNVSTFTDSIFVRPEIIAGFTATKLCEGTATQFHMPGKSAGNNITSWVWNFGDGVVSSEENPTHQYATPGTYTVSLTVTDICNNSKTFSKPITIYRNSVPDFNAPVEVCSYEPISFKEVSTVLDDTIVSWHWDFGNGDTSTSENPTYTYKHAGKFTVTLTITGKSGCPVSIAKPLSVKIGAEVDFSIQNACIDNQTVFSDLTTFADGTSLVSRTWDFGDGTTSELPNPVHEYAATGSYPVTLTVQNNVGCTTTLTKILQITRLPQVAFSFSLACQGEQTNFFDESVAMEGEIASWEWDFGDVNGVNRVSVEKGPNPTHIFTKPGKYLVKLKAFSNYGCVDSLTKEIEVLPSPKAGFTYDFNCATREVAFTDTSLSGNSTLTGWYWNFGDGEFSSERNPHHVYKSPGNYIVTLIATADSRCTNSFSQEVKITTQPVAAFDVTGLLCVNGTLEFIDKSTVINDTIISRVWDFKNFGKSTLSQPILTINSTESVIIPVSLTITTAAGCNATLVKDVHLQSPPQAAFTYQSALNANYLQINFVNTSNPDAVQFSWDFGDGQKSVQTAPSHTYTSPGVYSVILTAKNVIGCSSEYTQEVIVSTVPDTYELKLITVETSLNNGLLTLVAHVHNNSNKFLEKLDFITVADGSEMYINSLTEILQPKESINYTYTIPAGNSLPSSICVIVKDHTNQKTSNRLCISTGKGFVALRPYPNPAKRLVTLPFILPVTSAIKLTITDMLGREVSEISTDTLHSGFNEITANVERLKAGLYFITYNFQGNVTTHKIVIQ